MKRAPRLTRRQIAAQLIARRHEAREFARRICIGEKPAPPKWLRDVTKSVAGRLFPLVIQIEDVDGHRFTFRISELLTAKGVRA